MTTLTPVIQRFAEHMQSRRLSPNTQRSYISYVTKFARYHGRSPEELQPDAVNEYKNYLLDERHHSADSVNTFISAARFLYLQTLKKPWKREVFCRAVAKKKPRAAMIPDDVRCLFARVTGVKHRAALMLCYGAGLTAVEAVAVKAANIDAESGWLCIEYPRGGQSRSVSLSPALLEAIRTYTLMESPVGPWLFPSWRPGRHIGGGMLRRVCKEAWKLAKLPKNVTPRILRRSFAVCMSSSGDVPVIPGAPGPLSQLLVKSRKHTNKSKALKPE